MNRRGHTLSELALVLVILGLLGAVGLPRMQQWLDRRVVWDAKADVLAALDAARGAAVRLGTTVVLVEEAAGLLIRRSDSTATTVWRGPHPSRRGVASAGLKRPIRFGAEGLAVGVSNRTIVLTRRGQASRVVVSRLGRLR